MSKMEAISDDHVQREQAESGGSEDSRIREEDSLNEDREKDLKEEYWHVNPKSELFKLGDGKSNCLESAEDSGEEIAQLKRELEELKRKWKRERKTTIMVLRALADDIQKDEENSRMATITGALSYLFGKGVGLGSGAAFTGLGASLPLGAVGAVIAAVGGTTMAGTLIVNKVLRYRKVKNVCEAINTDAKETKNLQDKSDEVNEMMEKLKRLGRKNLIGPKGVEKAVQFSRSAIFTAMEFAKIFSGGLGETCRTVGGASRGLRLFGSVAGAALIPLDIYTLVSTFIKVRNGSIVQVVKEIRKLAQELENELLL
ncbi:uncharacterized protein LOC114520100 [Dendronephthya gigantea]|uniref:uncharacterized protein LOC114520100 n=1 Tax=Dendronephthya gigantea TaxID=151771 RepID=UPI00106CA085|nr:uncharacterized protein LOC114520100 [Dendronephthya gigantea]